MTTASTKRVPDPRPVVDTGASGSHLLGGRCTACGHPSPTTTPRCQRCGAGMAAAVYGPGGTIWSTTTIRVTSGDRPVPYTLAYVDLDDGPRLLAHVWGGPVIAARIGRRVTLIETAEAGDPQVRVI